MREKEFSKWLTNQGYGKGSVSTVISKCNMVEKYEGELDAFIDEGKFTSLIERLTYSSLDQKRRATPKHSIPINGNVYNSTAAYKNAVLRYFAFVNGTKSSMKEEPFIERPVDKKKRNTVWPEWECCSSDTIYRLAIDVVPYIKFLSPEIIEDVTRINQANRGNIISTLNECGIICPEKYMWEGSPCAYPGVRRSVGKGESKKKALGEAGFIENAAEKNTALYLDDNDMPKQIWSYILRGTYFSKVGPNGYSLAHLMDHKLSGNRMFGQKKGEKDGTITEVPGEFTVLNPGIVAPIYGLFSSPANAVYIPDALMKPTDFNTDLRKLLFQKAIDLYGKCCNVVPDGIKLVPPKDERFVIDNSDFKWGKTVGDLPDLKGNLEAFYEYRRDKFYCVHGFVDMYK